jgi:hypothetical protein
VNYFLCAHTIYALRPQNKRKPDRQPTRHSLGERDVQPEAQELWIVCRNCHQRLTRPSERTAINGSHQHTFANPSGVVFEIGCYRWAQGYVLTGLPSSDFSWFSGYNWQIVLCSACQSHLGWHFSGSVGGQFLGFILDQLTEISIST